MAVAATAVVCFLNVLPNEFCYDDKHIVEHNRLVNDPGQWSAIWTTDLWGSIEYSGPNRDLLYRPVTMTSYRVVRVLFGVRPLPHLVLNVLLHAIICVLAVRLTHCVARADRRAALVVGILYAVLPIHTEVVANVVGRADLLATLGVLAAVLCHRAVLIAESRTQAALWCAATSVAAFVAMGAKESGIGVVAVVVLFDVFRHVHDRRPESSWWTGGRLLRLGHLLVPLVVYLALRSHALGGTLFQQPPVSKTVNVLVDAPPWQHALGVVQLWGMYWAKTFWPAVLAVKYSINAIRPATTLWHPHVLLGLAVGIVLFAGSVLAWRRGRREVAFLSLALVITYAPAANAFVLIQVFFAERVWYLPSVWLAILVGLMLAPVMRVARVAWILMLAVSLGMGARVWVRSAEWRNNQTLYAAAYRDLPNAVGPLQLYGEWLATHGAYGRGVELLQRATAIDPGFTDAHLSLGAAYLNAGDYPAAVRALQLAVMQDSSNPRARDSLREAVERLSAVDPQGIDELRRRADAEPNALATQLALVDMLRRAGRIDEAIERLGRGEPQFADAPEWQQAYAITLVYAGRHDEAAARYRRYLELRPADVQGTVELAMLLLDRRDEGDVGEAERLCDRALDLAPDEPNVLACQAELAVLRGDIPAAMELYRRAAERLPSGGAQRAMFEQRMKSLGAD